MQTDGIEPSCAIAVMAKASEPGRTKTRLVPPLSFEEAARFNTAFLRDISANLQRAGEQADIRGYMAFGPPGTEDFFVHALPAGIGLVPAWFPNFGDCLFAAITQLLRRHQSAVVLNADSPTLPTDLLVQTAQVLAQPGDRGVLGPSDDGGYYLLGLKRAHRRLFDDIAWSTDAVAEQTLARAAEIGLPTHVLPPWYDVDEAPALRRLHAELFDGRSFDPALRPNLAENTRRLMGELLEADRLGERLGLDQQIVSAGG